jgi:hypothetical protein
MREGYYDYILRRYREEENKMSLKEDYVIVETVSSFRMRYVMSMEELQKLNPDMPVQEEWALDAVTCEEVEDFSQKWIGEHVIDHRVISEDEVIETFDRDNDYLKEWTREQKLQHIRCSLIHNKDNGDIYD